MANKNSKLWLAQVVIQTATILTIVLGLIKVLGLGYIKWESVLFPLRFTLTVFIILFVIYFSLDFIEKLIEMIRRIQADGETSEEEEDRLLNDSRIRKKTIRK